MFELAQPWLLFLLPLPLFLWILLPKARVALPAALRVPFYQAMSHVIANENRNLVSQGQVSLFLVIWILLILALAGPRWVGAPLPMEREGRNLMMALDLSGSMQLDDMMLNGRPASRLAVVKQAAKQFVDDRAGDKVGLILFGAKAYLQTPLTYDLHSVLQRIDDATVGLAGKTTSIGDAIGLAVKRLEQVPEKGRVIILLTDGANNSGVLTPLKAAELAKMDHIKIYTIGLGSNSDPRAIGSVFLSLNPSADLDEDTLKQVANMTGGRYFRATDPKSLQAIYKMINQLETTHQEQASVRPQKEFYPWPLALALMIFCYWFLAHAHVARKEYHGAHQNKEVHA